MIRKTWQPDKWLLITQVEQARVAGLMAASWNFPGRKPHRDVVHAVAHHAIAWRETDAAPALNAAGQPATCSEAGIQTLTELWTTTVKALDADGKHYGARVAGAHFVSLARNVQNTARLSARAMVALGRFVGSENVALQRFRRTAGAVNDATTVFEDSDEVGEPADPMADFNADVRLLRVCSLLAGMVCDDFAGETVIDQVPYLAEGDTLTVTRANGGGGGLVISPLPFRKNLRDHITGVPVPVREYASADELAEVMAAAKPLVVEWHVGAPG